MTIARKKKPTIDKIKKQLDDWVKSPEREKHMKESIRIAEATKKYLAEATRINPCDLDRPITI